MPKVKSRGTQVKHLLLSSLVVLTCVNAVQINRVVIRQLNTDPTLIQLADLTPIGAFDIPNPSGDDIDFGGGLALRRVSGTPYLYSTGLAGKTVEYTIPADGSLAMTAPFTTATATGQYGDIFQNAGYQSVVSDGGAGGPRTGLAGNWRPNSLCWDETDSRLYWTAGVRYDNDFSPIASDNSLGYSTLNFVAKTGTGVATWKLSPRASGTITDAMTNVGNRWATGCTTIASGFATTYLGGKRLGVGFGDPSMSILSNGPGGMGPAFFALDPATLNVAQDRTYFAGTLQKLIFHPYQSSYAAPFYKTRPSGLSVVTFQGTSYDPYTNYVSWADKIAGGVWIKGPTKEGLLIPSIGPTGSMHTTISASPTPTNTVFTVVDKGDTAIGDQIFCETVGTQGNPNYKFARSLVTGVSGQQLTVNNVKNAYDDTTDTSIHLAGGFCLAGTTYVGGGNKVTRMQSMVYIYSTTQLALSAAGSITASAIPASSEGLVDFPGWTWPMRAVDGSNVTIGGVAYDDVTKRLYIRLMNIPVTGSIVAVFAVNS